MSYQRIVVANITEFISRVLDFSNATDLIWYRGHTSHLYHLEPSAYRFPRFVKESKETEWNSIAAAKAEMLHIEETQRLNIDLDWLCFLQHNRMPTRLLDWTVELHVSLYFAFEDYIKGRATPGSLPCLWIIKPKLFIQGIKNYINGPTPYPFGLKDDAKHRVLEYFKDEDPKNTHSIKGEISDLLDDVYIPFVSPYINERAKMQGGCFVRFPLLNSAKPTRFKECRLENFIGSKDDFSSCMAQFIFIYPNSILKELSVFNLESKRIYPEVENIALSIKRRIFQSPL